MNKEEGYRGKEYTRRRFINLSLHYSLFCTCLPGIGYFGRLRERAAWTMKRFIFQGSHPVIETTVKKTWKNGSLIVGMKGKGYPIFRLNKTSGFILEWCDGKHTPSDIVKKLEREFDVHENRAREDALDTLEAFYKNGLIKV